MAAAASAAGAGAAAVAGAAAAAAAGAAADDDSDYCAIGGGVRYAEILPESNRLGRHAADIAGFGVSIPKVNCVVKKANARRSYTPPGEAQVH